LATASKNCSSEIPVLAIKCLESLQDVVAIEALMEHLIVVAPDAAVAAVAAESPDGNRHGERTFL
jgi:hypothetical protein